LLIDTNLPADEQPISFQTGAEYTVTPRSFLLFTLLPSTS